MDITTHIIHGVVEWMIQLLLCCRDIIDLNEIAVDLNREVVTQGKGIDRIELHTEKAASRVEKATKITDETVIMKRDNRTLLIIVLLVAGGVLLFIVVVIVVLAVVLGVVLA
jgi:t-SNARE complex subunit (syntaxin)